MIDLLSKTRKPGGLKIREDQHQGFYVDGLKLVPCDNYAQIERLMDQGNKMRTTATTTMNTSSSRSHMVVTIQFKQVQCADTVSTVFLTTSGSERAGGNTPGFLTPRLQGQPRQVLALTLSHRCSWGRDH